MPEQRRYRELLERIKEAHRRHADAYHKARSTYGVSRKAHEATAQEREAFYAELKFFDEGVIQPLTKVFLAGEPVAVSEVIELLEVDVPAFRVGYTKEWYYRKLKRVQLSPAQAERLKAIAMLRCSSKEYRREDSELRRLMIRLADHQFLQSLRNLPVSTNPYVRRKRALMLEVILRGRKDLVGLPRRSFFVGVVDGVQNDFADGAVGEAHVFEQVEDAGAIARGNEAGAGGISSGTGRRSLFCS